MLMKHTWPVVLGLFHAPGETRVAATDTELHGELLVVLVLSVRAQRPVEACQQPALLLSRLSQEMRQCNSSKIKIEIVKSLVPCGKKIGPIWEDPYFSPTPLS